MTGRTADGFDYVRHAAIVFTLALVAVTLTLWCATADVPRTVHDRPASSHSAP